MSAPAFSAKPVVAWSKPGEIHVAHAAFGDVDITALCGAHFRGEAMIPRWRPTTTFPLWDVHVTCDACREVLPNVLTRDLA